MKKGTGKKGAPRGSPVARAIKKMAPLPTNFLQALRLREWSAMEALQKGGGTITDVALMVEMLLMCEAFIDCGIGPEAQQACDEAEKALDSIDNETEKISLNIRQMEIIRDLHAFHDQQREICTVGDYEKAVLIVDSKARTASVQKMIDKIDVS